MQAFILFLSTFLLSFSIAPKPILSSEWCQTQPCLDFFGITINQISSSILVYALAFYGLFVGYRFFKNKVIHTSRLYWSISLILGGLGALAAGTSFQAFGYELKCAGNVFCDRTSSFEILYNILSVWSAGVLLLAISASFLQKSRRRSLTFATILHAAFYTILCLVAYGQDQFIWISFEFLLLYISPVYLAVFVLTGIEFKKRKNMKTHKYFTAWLILMLTIIAYYIYSICLVTEYLWLKGLWFSANDVLHLGMMGWLYYLSNYLMSAVEDCK